MTGINVGWCVGFGLWASICVFSCIGDLAVICFSTSVIKLRVEMEVSKWKQPICGLLGVGVTGEWLSDLFFTLLNKRFYLSYHTPFFPPTAGLISRMISCSASRALRSWSGGPRVWAPKFTTADIKSLRRSSPSLPPRLNVGEPGWRGRCFFHKTQSSKRKARLRPWIDPISKIAWAYCRSQMAKLARIVTSTGSSMLANMELTLIGIQAMEVLVFSRSAGQGSQPSQARRLAGRCVLHGKQYMLAV